MTDISRDFPSIVDLGAGKGHIYKHVNTYTTKHVIECDTAAGCLAYPRQDIQVRNKCAGYGPSFVWEQLCNGNFFVHIGQKNAWN